MSPLRENTDSESGAGVGVVVGMVAVVGADAGILTPKQIRDSPFSHEEYRLLVFPL